MHQDLLTTFATNKVLAVGAFGDVIDLTTAGIDQGAGNGAIRLAVVALTALTGANINLVTSATADLAAETVLASTGVITVPAGSIAFSAPLPSSVNYKRFLGLKVVAGTAGNVTAFLTPDTPTKTIYKANPA